MLGLHPSKVSGVGWTGATLLRETSGVGCSGIHPIPDQKVGSQTRVQGLGDTRFTRDRFFPAARHKVGTYPYFSSRTTDFFPPLATKYVRSDTFQS